MSVAKRAKQATWRLFQVDNKLREIVDEAAENGGEISDDLAYLFKHASENLPSLLDDCRRIDLELGGMVATSIQEENRLADRRRRIEATSRNLREQVCTYLRLAGADRVETPLGQVRLQKNPPSVRILDESLLPSEYIRVRIEPNKSDILEALKKNKEVSGACLSDDTYGVRFA